MWKPPRFFTIYSGIAISKVGGVALLGCNSVALVLQSNAEGGLYPLNKIKHDRLTF